MRKLLLVPLLFVSVSVLAAVCAAASAGSPPRRIEALRARPEAAATGERPRRITSPSTFAMGVLAFAAFAALQWRRRRTLAESAL